MIIDKVCLGTWFPRTNLHLEEVFRFVKEGVGPNGLNEKELVNKRNQLEIEQASFEEYPINSVILNTKRVKTTITEDGVILLQTSVEEVTRSVNR